MATSSTSGGTSAPLVVDLGAISDPVVDYPDYTYYLTARICGPDHKIYGVRVHYTE